MLKFGAITCVVMLILGILAAGSEFRHRTIVPVLRHPAPGPRLRGQGGRGRRPGRGLQRRDLRARARHRRGDLVGARDRSPPARSRPGSTWARWSQRPASG
jgi:hypothetical protein